MLAGVLVVGDAVLDTLSGRIPEINQQRNHREDKHAEDLKRKCTNKFINKTNMNMFSKSKSKIAIISGHIFKVLIFFRFLKWKF